MNMVEGGSLIIEVKMLSFAVSYRPFGVSILITFSSCMIDAISLDSGPYPLLPFDLTDHDHDH